MVPGANHERPQESPSRRLPRFRFPFHSFEKINDSDAQSLGNQVQTGKRDVHPAIFKGADLCSMKTRKVRKLILCPALP